MSEKRGITLPLTISPATADVATASGPELREAHLGVVLGMRASSAGEIGEWLPDPDRGSQLDALRNAKESAALADFAVVYVDQALTQALPDERLREVEVVVEGSTMSITATTQLASDASRAPRAVTKTVTFKS